MFTWNQYYVETQRRNDEIAMAMQDRFDRAATEISESRITRLSFKILDLMGKKLVQWGSQLQCRTAEWAMSSSKRAI